MLSLALSRSERAGQESRRIQAARQQATDLLVHDLQNPLAGITALLQMLEADPESLSQERREMIREALGRCDDLSRMILDVLQISRAEQGIREVCVEAVDVSRLADDVVRSYGPAAKRTGHSLQVESGVSVTAQTDESLLKRILHNLIQNALRHTPSGTTVVVRVESPEPGTVRLGVEDDGPGIPLKIQALLFEPFCASAIRSIGGRADTGLGLTSCRAAARSLGTDISVESDGTCGTVFSLQLSALMGSAQEVPRNPAAEPSMSAIHLLLASESHSD